jgi:hypothetical protein
MVVAGLGVYHGLNPAMGWLFAVAHGLQEGRAWGVVKAIPPIVAGHALSVGAVLLTVTWLGSFVPALLIKMCGAAMLVGFAAYLLTRRMRHPRSIGMRAGFRDLTFWSFVMASAHGSGLMLLPVLVRESAPSAAAHATHVHAGTAGAGTGMLLVFAVHAAAMLAALTMAALVSYRVLGIAFLRRAWINLDAIWITALIVAGIATLLA